MVEISREEAIRCITNYIYSVCQFIPERVLDSLDKAMEDMRKIEEIEKQPTTYHIDKIVEELENCSFNLEPKCKCGALPIAYVRLNKAIEIVKNGGRINDN